MSIKHSRSIHDIRKAVNKVHDQAARIAMVEGENFFKESFRKQGWDGEAWEPRKNDKDPGRAILTKSGRLKRSFKRQLMGNRMSRVENEAEYAQTHNEGLRIRGNQYVRGHKRRQGNARVNVKPHSRKVDFKIKKRQFMGNSSILNSRIKAKLMRKYKQAIG